MNIPVSSKAMGPLSLLFVSLLFALAVAHVAVETCDGESCEGEASSVLMLHGTRGYKPRDIRGTPGEVSVATSGGDSFCFGFRSDGPPEKVGTKAFGRPRSDWGADWVLGSACIVEHHACVAVFVCALLRSVY